MSRVKLCGLRRPEDARAANECMPEYAGFVFAPSKRQVSHESAAKLRGILDPKILTVGVFVNAGVEEIAALVKAGTIDMVQLHGDEDEAYIEEVKARTGAPVIRMVPVGESLPPLPRNADFLLFDTLSEKRGGTGRAFNWRLLEQLDTVPYFLAGGLHVGNVQDAVARLDPYAVDVSSGIETDGVKDSEKMYLFTKRARGKGDGSHPPQARRDRTYE